MYIGLKHLHSFTAYLSLLTLIIAVFYTVINMIGKKPFSKLNAFFSLEALIFAHIQLLFGLILYFVSPMGLSNFSGMAMKNSITRLYILEHPLMMIIAVVLITIGYIRAKRLPADNQKYKNISIYYGIALLLILSRIPWSIWLQL